MRDEVTRIYQRSESRGTLVEQLAAALNPGFPNLATAAQVAAELKREEERDLQVVQRLTVRLDEAYPSVEAVPDDEVMLYAKVIGLRFRAWCWNQNSGLALELASQHAPRQDHTAAAMQVVAELEQRYYTMDLVTLMGRALDTTAAALARLVAMPERVDLELADLLLDLQSMGINVAFRKWDPAVKRRAEPRIEAFRDAATRLPGAIGPATGRVAMALWDLGMASAAVRKVVRDQLVAALGEYGELAATYPKLGDVKKRIEGYVLKPATKR